MDLFEHAERYPNAPGYRRTDTSKEAAEKALPWNLTLRRQILLWMQASGLPTTADECAARFEIDKLAVRPRFTELKLEGLIEDTGIRRRNDSGRRAIVWRLAPPKH